MSVLMLRPRVETDVPSGKFVGILDNLETKVARHKRGQGRVAERRHSASRVRLAASGSQCQSEPQVLTAQVVQRKLQHGACPKVSDHALFLFMFLLTPQAHRGLRAC